MNGRTVEKIAAFAKAEKSALRHPFLAGAEANSGARSAVANAVVQQVVRRGRSPPGISPLSGRELPRVDILRGAFF
ncbi:MAG: hypothetical protein JO051_12465 [Acidobacteriaceae bacterium]|nr:hypothetical protein [Acidobacteriaceae bacterium]